MEIEFKVSYPTNLYYHIENLSRWHGFYRKRYAEHFLKGKSAKSLSLLKKYASFRERGQDSSFDSSFSSASLQGVKKSLEGILQKRDLEIALEAIGHFDKEYKKAWESAGAVSLEKLKVSLGKSFGKTKNAMFS